MKRPFSLLEVTIGLALAAILITSLFATFRHLTNAQRITDAIEQEKHGDYLMQLRLNKVFEAIPAHSVFSLEPYGDKIKEALHFTFDNGIDPDPYFCRQQEGYLGVNEQNTFCLYIEPQFGLARKEIFLEDATNIKIEFFDPKKKGWTCKWERDFLPPLVKVSYSSKEFFFELPQANKVIQLS